MDVETEAAKEAEVYLLGHGWTRGVLTWHLSFLRYSKLLQSKPPNLLLSLTYSGFTEERREQAFPVHPRWDYQHKP